MTCPVNCGSELLENKRQLLRGFEATGSTSVIKFSKNFTSRVCIDLNRRPIVIKIANTSNFIR